MPIAATVHRPLGYKPRKKWERKDGTPTQRGYGYQWQKLRKIVIARDNALCQPCLKVGRVTQFQQVDHIIPKAKGGTDDIDNCQCICIKCHNTKTSTYDNR